MINILIPLAGKSNQFFPKDEYPFPKPLIELNNKTIIEHVLNNFDSIQEQKQFIFVIDEEDCKNFSLDSILNILTNHNCKIIKLRQSTKGAACSVLMAIEFINNSTSLIIANSDQLFDFNLQEALNAFTLSDAGVITFESVHPRWSYVSTDENNQVIEVAEKRPISKNAIAGFYYFKHGTDFVNSSMRMIEKDANVNDLYYIAPALNELILDNKLISTFHIKNEVYHTFYSPQKIKEYNPIKT